MVVHLEDVRSNGAAGKREKAADLLDMLRTTSFIYVMNFMIVNLTQRTVTFPSKNDLTVDYVIDKIEAVKVSLKKWKGMTKSQK